MESEAGKQESKGNGGGVAKPQSQRARRKHSDLKIVENSLKFSISLTREEIEKDLAEMTGSKPNRKPKKRSKADQKTIDKLTPGLKLNLVTPNSYGP